MIISRTFFTRMSRVVFVVLLLSGVSMKNAKACYSFFSAERACAGDTVWFYPADPTAVYAWSFGDTASGSDNVSFDSVGYHIYNTPGVYYVTLFTNIGAEWDYYTREIVIGTDCFMADFTSYCGSGLWMYFSDFSVGQPQSWAWSFGDPASGAANTSALQNPSHQYTSGGNYLVQLIISDGLNADTITRGIFVSTNCISASVNFDISGVCAGDSAKPYINCSGVISSYSWNFGDPASGADNFSNLANPFHIYANSGLYVVTLIISDGMISDTIQEFVTVIDCRVWPGDGNRDGEVNGDDLLPIGIYYSATGTVRAGAVTTWSPQQSDDWPGFQSFMYLQDFVNAKHADCDGNGIIDSADMNVIAQNFGMKHGNPNNRSVMLFVRPSDPSLEFGNSYYPSVTGVNIDIPLVLTNTDSVRGIYGVSTTILYDNAMVDGSTISVDFDNSWIGDEGDDMIALWDNDEAKGQLTISMVRTNKLRKNGMGAIALLHLTLCLISHHGPK